MVEHHGEHFDFQPLEMSPNPSKPLPILIGGISKPALRRAATLGDGWLGSGQTPDEGVAILEKLNALRKEAGLYEQPFDYILSPMELISQDFIDSLDPQGTYHSSVLPWTPSPWGRAFWVEESEDHTQLEIKFKAMERFRDMMHGLNLWED